MTDTAISYDLLEFYITFIERKNRKVYTDYSELATQINNTFNKKITGRDIWLHYEPTISDEELDKKIHYEVIL